jgi:hypothetical protein
MTENGGCVPPARGYAGYGGGNVWPLADRASKAAIASGATLLGSEARSRQLLASNLLSTVARLGTAKPSYGAI